MDHGSDDFLRRWLTAESSGRSEEAEAALSGLLAGLPGWEPPAGFADRVMLAVAQGAAAPAAVPRRSLFASGWLRAGLAFTLAAAALAAAFAPDLLLALLQVLTPGRVMELCVRGLTATIEGLAAAFHLLLGYDAVGRAAARLLAAPQVGAGLAACVLVSAICFHLLMNLLSKRSWSHVQSI